MSKLLKEYVFHYKFVTESIGFDVFFLNLDTFRKLI